MSFDISVSRQLGSLKLAVDISRPGGILGLFGPSGIGKSSLLNMVAGLLRPDAGHIIVDGTTLFDQARRIDLPIVQRQCGYIFQDLRLFPHMSVRANLLYGSRRARHDRRPAVSFDSIVDLLGLSHLLNRHSHALSGGEAQRVAIGRALLSAPRILLMDEPLTGLDHARRQDILALIARSYAETQIPILYVSHDRRELEYLTDDIVHLPVPRTIS